MFSNSEVYWRREKEGFKKMEDILESFSKDKSPSMIEDSTGQTMNIEVRF